MARVKTFRITRNYGVPDEEIRKFLAEAEDEAIVNVEAVFIPAYGETPDGNPMDPKLTVIVTKLDDKGRHDNV